MNDKELVLLPRDNGVGSTSPWILHAMKSIVEPRPRAKDNISSLSAVCRKFYYSLSFDTVCPLLTRLDLGELIQIRSVTVTTDNNGDTFLSSSTLGTMSTRWWHRRTVRLQFSPIITSPATRPFSISPWSTRTRLNWINWNTTIKSRSKRLTIEEQRRFCKYRSSERERDRTRLPRLSLKQNITSDFC